MPVVLSLFLTYSCVFAHVFPTAHWNVWLSAVLTLVECSHSIWPGDRNQKSPINMDATLPIGSLMSLCVCVFGWYAVCSVTPCPRCLFTHTDRDPVAHWWCSAPTLERAKELSNAPAPAVNNASLCATQLASAYNPSCLNRFTGW